MNNIDIMNFWIESAMSDYDTMKLLFKNGKYSWSLFIWQLVIEKFFKALYAKKNKSNPHAPRSHDLVYLADKCNVKYDDRQNDLLEEITRFCLDGRYDDYKKNFKAKCTKEFTLKKLEDIEEVIIWLKRLLEE